jgi:hypothetical protein
MTAIEDVRKAIRDALELSRIGLKEEKDKLAAIEQIKINISRYENEIVKLEASLRALEGHHNPPAAPESEGKHLSGLPRTGLEFYLDLLDTETGRTAADILPLAIHKMGGNLSVEQSKLVSGRIGNALSVLVKDGRAIQEGTKGSYKYRRVS